MSISPEGPEQRPAPQTSHSPPPPEELRALLVSAPTHLQEIFLQARARILAMQPEAQEKITPGYRSAAFGWGTAMAQQYCALILHTRHVNLQFFRGASLPDPEGLLEGSGKAMRHIKLGARGDVDREGVADLIREAARERAPSDG